nr:hypothetical protein CFP56_67621 [Quercus suber]
MRHAGAFPSPQEINFAIDSFPAMFHQVGRFYDPQGATVNVDMEPLAFMEPSSRKDVENDDSRWAVEMLALLEKRLLLSETTCKSTATVGNEKKPAKPDERLLASNSQRAGTVVRTPVLPAFQVMSYAFSLRRTCARVLRCIGSSRNMMSVYHQTRRAVTNERSSDAEVALPTYRPKRD